MNEILVLSLIQSFAPDFQIEETPVYTLNSDFEITNCIYIYNKINVVSFTVRIKKSTGAIEFKIGTTKYYAFGPEDKYKICDFITHLEILSQDLILKYSQITKYLNAVPKSNTLTEYILIGKNGETNGTLRIKNDRYIFDSKEISRYTYSSLTKLLGNPLVHQFKKSNRWFW
jgi:hypothetical protein